VLHEHPYIVYSGNTQGRHARETGPKGCLLVAVDENCDGGEVREVEFRETNHVRWFHATIALQPENDEDELFDMTRNHLREIVSAADGRLAAVRLEITGRCAVHARVARDDTRQQLIANLRGLASDFGDDVWIEKIKFDTQSPLDFDELRERQDLIGQLVRDIESLAQDPQSLLALPETKELAAKLGPELLQVTEDGESFNLDDPARRVAWLRDAEAFLLSHLLE
jgi:DNA repair protein SbcD/Mre11